MVDASVIVPARDAAATIGDTLAALAAQDVDATYEVIVADDGSTDDTVSIAERTPGVTVVRGDRLGPGEARNNAVRAASGRVLAFTDADCRPVPGWLRAGIAELESADLVQGKVVPDGDPVWAFDHTIFVLRETGLYETANLFVTREMYDRVDGFEDWLEVSFGKRLGEDVWFGWKVRRAGGRTAFSKEALVYHAWIRRNGKAYVLDRARRYYFPAMLARMPELRRMWLIGGLFLSAQSAAFAGAVAGIAAAVALGIAVGPLAAIPALLATVPYAAQPMILPRVLRMSPRYRPKVLTVEVAADAVSFAAMLAGSVRYRAPML